MATPTENTHALVVPENVATEDMDAAKITQLSGKAFSSAQIRLHDSIKHKARSYHAYNCRHTVVLVTMLTSAQADAVYCCHWRVNSQTTAQHALR